MIYKFKKLTSSIIVTIFIFFTIISSVNVSAVIFEKADINFIDKASQSLAEGVIHSWYKSKTNNGFQNINSITIDLENEKLELLAGRTYGKVEGMQTLTSTAKDIESKGYKVISGINADFYDMSNGVPLGIFIENGIVLSSDKNITKGVGIDKNNNPIISDVEVKSSFTYNNTTFEINAINKNRGSNSLNLYTYDFATTTQVNNQGYEILLKIKSEEKNISPGKDIIAEVIEIREGKIGATLEKDLLVLSASGKYIDSLKNIDIGSEITITTNITDGLENAKVLLGGRQILLQNGEIINNNDNSIAPRTAVGITEDKKLMFFTVDGRNPGFSEGVTFNELAGMMKNAGCIEAINLDGGGSTTMIAKIPGDLKHTVLNIPSDGGERSIANSFILASKDLGEGIPTSIYVRPTNERVLINSSINLNSIVIDEYYNKVNDEFNLTYEVIPENIGEISSNGTFVAKEIGDCVIKVSSNGFVGYSNISVVDTLTELKLESSSISLQPSEVKEFNFKRSTINDKDVSIDKSLLTWEVIGDIGIIDENGAFIATDKTGVEGIVRVSYGEVQDECKITIGQLPIILEDFEYGLDYEGRKWSAEGARYTSINIESENNKEFVRFGEKSLKLSYDFTGTQGTSGIYANSTPSIDIPGYPTEIGMWVYGDGNGHWLRGQLRDRNNAAVAIDFTENGIGVDWEGWRYVSAKIPLGRPLPLKMDLPVRYMETNNNNKDSGTIYVDNIRAVYGFTNDDLEAPKANSLIPENNSIVNSSTPTIKCNLSDNITIDKETIKLIVDGTDVLHAYYPPEGRVSYTPVAPLTNGKHTVKIIAKDSFGNKLEESWSFIVDVDAPKINISAPDSAYPNDNFMLNIISENTNDLEGLDLDLGFDINQISVENIDINESLIDNVISSEIDNNLGMIKLKISNIAAGSINNDDIMAAVKIKVNENNISNIKFNLNKGFIKYKSLSNPIEFFKEINEVSLSYPLVLTWDKESTVLGYNSTLKVIDNEGYSVNQANIILAETNEIIGVTDENGLIETKKLTENLSTKNLKVVKNNLFSKVYSFKIVNYSGFNYPTNISMSFIGDTKNSIGFNWHSSAAADTSIIQYTEASDISFENYNTVIAESYIDITDLGARKIYKANLDNLKEGTDYIYRIGNESSFQVEGSFKTAEKNNEEFSFIFMTDPQASNEIDFKYWNNMLNSALQNNNDLDFLMMGGDLVEQGYDQTQWDYFFKSGQNNLLNIPIVSTVGNHEVMGVNSVDDFNKHFNNPSNGPIATKNSTYSYDYGNSHFIVLNTEMNIDEQILWLKDDLSKKAKDFTIVTMHRGPYGSIYDEQVIRDKFTPVFDEYKVDLVLSGHDHVYARSYSMKDGNIMNAGDGTLYLLGGTSGPKTYAAIDRPWLSYSYDCNITKEKIYSIITINKDIINIEAKNSKNEIIDTIQINKKDSNIIVSKPINLISESLNNNSIKLEWESPKSINGLIGYKIYKDGKEIGEVNSKTLSYTVDGLNANTIYAFKVASKYSNGEVSKPISINVRTMK